MKSRVTVTLESRTVDKVDKLARRFGRSRSQAIEILLDAAMSEQKVCDYMVGGPKNFNRLVRVVRWAIGDGEASEEDIEAVKVAI